MLILREKTTHTDAFESDNKRGKGEIPVNSVA